MGVDGKKWWWYVKARGGWRWVSFSWRCHVGVAKGPTQKKRPRNLVGACGLAPQLTCPPRVHSNPLRRRSITRFFFFTFSCQLHPLFYIRPTSPSKTSNTRKIEFRPIVQFIWWSNKRTYTGHLILGQPKNKNTKTSTHIEWHSTHLQCLHKGGLVHAN